MTGAETEWAVMLAVLFVVLCAALFVALGAALRGALRAALAAPLAAARASVLARLAFFRGRSLLQRRRLTADDVGERVLPRQVEPCARLVGGPRQQLRRHRQGDEQKRD